MSSWLLFLNNDIFATDGNLYACTQSAWASISKFIVLLLEECCGSIHLNECSGVLKGYVSLEGYRYIWFDKYQGAGPSDVEVTQFSEKCALSHRNMLYWFYLPPEYRQCLLYYVDLKRVLVGRVPFKVTTRDEVLPLAFSDECTRQTSTELYLLTEDSRDLLFYCIQSQHLSVENVVTTIGSWNSTENSCVVGFSHLPFRCISVLEACNIPVDQVPVQLRAMIDCLEGHFSVESSEDLKEAITYAPSNELQVDGTGLLERVKDEPDGELKVTQETQQNIDEHLLQQAEESPQHDSTPSLRAKGRTRPNSRGERIMSYRKLLSISKSYGELAASKEYANRKLWRALSSRVVPTVLLQCPGCGKYFPQSSPKSLSNMLTHMRSKHFENNAKLLLSISDVLDVLIPFMQKKIALWNRREMRSTW